MNPENKNDSRNNEKCSLITISASELSAITKRIDQLEESVEKQQGRIISLERENHTLKTQLNNLNGLKEGGSVDDIESKSPASPSAGKTAKTNNDDDDEAVVIPRPDNGDSFDSLSDDLLHKIVEFDGNCYEKCGSINKRCKNIYDMEEYKLKKQTCVYGYGTVDMMLQHYLQRRKEDELDLDVRENIAAAVIIYTRLDAIDWIIQLADIELLKELCQFAAYYGRINILSKVFCKCNLTILDEVLNDRNLCSDAALNGKLETLKWLRNHGAEWDTATFYVASREGHDEIVQYLRAEGCPEPP